MANFYIESGIMELARGFNQSELFPSSGGGGFDFIKRHISGGKICALVSDIDQADFSPDNLSDGAIVAAYGYSAYDNPSDYSEILFKGTARACLEFMAALPRVDMLALADYYAREIGAAQAAEFNDTGETKYFYSQLCEKSGVEIINPFTSECARFDFTTAQASANYGAEFIGAWITGALDHYGAEIDLS